MKAELNRLRKFGLGWCPQTIQPRVNASIREKRIKEVEVVAFLSVIILAASLTYLHLYLSPTPVLFAGLNPVSVVSSNPLLQLLSNSSTYVGVGIVKETASKDLTGRGSIVTYANVSVEQTLKGPSSNLIRFWYEGGEAGEYGLGIYICWPPVGRNEIVPEGGYTVVPGERILFFVQGDQLTAVVDEVHALARIDSS